MGCDMSFLKKAKLGEGSGADEQYEKRILLLGLDNAGKTSILFHLRDNSFKETVPTVGLNIENITYKRYNITFWDVGGQATKLWKHYFDHIEGVVFVIDSTDEERLMFSKEELKRVLRDESLGIVPFLLLYNKQDLIDKAKSLVELNTILDIDKLSQEREISVQQCSAVNGQGIWEGIDKMIAMFEERKNAVMNNQQHQSKQNDQQINQQMTSKEHQQKTTGTKESEKQ